MARSEPPSDASAVVDYDPNWPATFGAVGASVAPALLWTNAVVEHVGSTAVPGLAARPVIDVDVVVSDSAELEVVLDRLRAIGYRDPGDVGRKALRPPDGAPAHELSVVVAGTATHLDDLALRDYLRRSDAAARGYGEQKRSLAPLLSGGDRREYEAAKAVLLEALVTAARETRMQESPLVPRLDPEAMVWSTPERRPRRGQPLVVCMHGFYGNEDDLVAIFDDLPRDELVAVSLRGPLAIGDRWAWTSFLMDPGYFAAATAATLEWLDALLPPTRVGLVGYSQGGAAALQLLREAPTRFACAAILAGFVLPRPAPGDAAVAELRPPVFSGRGMDDDALPGFYVDATSDWLGGHARLVERRYPDMGHLLDPRLRRDAAAFVAPALLGRA